MRKRWVILIPAVMIAIVAIIIWDSGWAKREARRTSTISTGLLKLLNPSQWKSWPKCRTRPKWQSAGKIGAALPSCAWLLLQTTQMMTFIKTADKTAASENAIAIHNDRP